MEILLIKTADNAKPVVFSLMMLKNRGIIKVMGFMTELTEKGQCDGVDGVIEDGVIEDGV